METGYEDGRVGTLWPGAVTALSSSSSSRDAEFTVPAQFVSRLTQNILDDAFETFANPVLAKHRPDCDTSWARSFANDNRVTAGFLDQCIGYAQTVGAQPTILYCLQDLRTEKSTTPYHDITYEYSIQGAGKQRVPLSATQRVHRGTESDAVGRAIGSVFSLIASGNKDLLAKFQTR